MSAASQGIAVTKALSDVMRNDRGRLLAALIARLRDFQLAEEVLQEAGVSALTHWSRTGLPSSPQGWLLRVAMRKAIDRLRGAKRDSRRAAEMSVLAADEADETEPDMIVDERLRLIFTCCHPAIEAKSRVALTLRTLGGLTTPEIARVFLDVETTMGQRLTRAKTKIAAAGIPFAVPGPEEWQARLNSVLTVVYLIFTTGHALGPRSERDLCAEAVFLARLLNELRPGDAEIEGTLALLLLTHARSPARLSATGETIPLADHDRSLWDTAMMAEGHRFLDRAIARRSAGPFQIKAAISACHALPDGSDWPQIAALYAALHQYEPTPVIRLNHAVAMAEGQRPDVGLRLMVPLADELQDYQPFHAAMAEYMGRAGRHDESRAAYDRAIALALSPADVAFLIKRRAMLPL